MKPRWLDSLRYVLHSMSLWRASKSSLILLGGRILTHTMDNHSEKMTEIGILFKYLQITSFQIWKNRILYLIPYFVFPFICS